MTEKAIDPGYYQRSVGEREISYAIGTLQRYKQGKAVLELSLIHIWKTTTIALWLDTTAAAFTTISRIPERRLGSRRPHTMKRNDRDGAKKEAQP